MVNRGKFVDSIHHYNTESEKITITEDKVRLMLINYKDNVSRTSSLWEIAGLVLTIISVLLTAQFRTVIGISSETWYSFFSVILFLSILYLIYKIYFSVKYFIGKNKYNSIDYVVSRMKNSND